MHFIYPNLSRLSLVLANIDLSGSIFALSSLIILLSTLASSPSTINAASGVLASIT